MLQRYLILALFVTGCAPQPDWEAQLSEFVHHEMQHKNIPAVSLTIATGTDYTWTRSFGLPEHSETEQPVYRVASVSKLFTAIAVMQLVEQGVLDLDAPVATYVPEFRPENPFDRAITLRQLLSHRSGIIREPPVGHYFDDTEPSLERTIASINTSRLVVAPESLTKYSNAAVSVAGYIVEQVTGVPFEEHVQRALLTPLEMASTSFTPRPGLRDRLLEGYMWRYDTDELTEAPVFELGIGPAANLYTTTEDLGRFMHALSAISANEEMEILSSPTLQEMWTPQYLPETTLQGFGLGFYVTQHNGERMVGHAGMMYGYATQLWFLPDRQVGVAVVTNLDASNAVADRIARYALDLVTDATGNVPAPPRTDPVDSIFARTLDGTYRNEHRELKLIERNGTLLMDYGALRNNVGMLGEEVTPDDRLSFDPIRVVPNGDTLESSVGPFVRSTREKPAPATEALKAYVGEYGWDHNVLYVYEDNQQLHVLIEWFFRYPLENIAPDMFRFPDTGLYMHETLTFMRDSDGEITEANLSGVPFRRRGGELSEDEVFRIVPQASEEVLRSRAAEASPPVQEGAFRTPDLVDVTTLDPTIWLDIRYATSNNFMGMPFYQSPRAFLQRPAAEALARASQALAQEGYGLIVYDGYRPWRVTKMFWDATPDSLRLFVANPAYGSRHNRGCAIDLGLYDLATGTIALMPSGYDEFASRAYSDYPGGTALSRYHRELLRDAMEEEGFTVYEAEWWHFDYRDWRQYPIMNAPLEELN